MLHGGDQRRYSCSGNTGCIGHREQPENDDAGVRYAALPQWPFDTPRIVEHLMNLRLSIRGRNRKRGSGVVLDRLMSTEKIFDERFFVNRLSVIFMSPSDRSASHPGSQDADEEQQCHKCVKNEVGSYSEQTGADREQRGIEHDVVDHSIRVQLDLKPVFLQGNPIEIE